MDISFLRELDVFIKNERLFTADDRLLLAVSGGLDSVVLCELLHRAGYRYVIAHCNFRLRGAESQRDEDFVRQLAAKYGVEILVKEFDTSAYATSNKLSIQVAARQLRYDWFNALVAEGVADLIVTAHHQDDNIETLLMNFFKGTGITGLRGMLPRHDKLVRPLLFAGKEDLHQFALTAGLKWVEDSSNLSDKYTRNYFRHQLIPLLQEVYPGALQNLAGNIGRFREIEMVYRKAIDQQLSRLMERRGQEIFIPVLKLQRSTPLATLVYELITPLGFSAQQTTAIIDLLDSASGKYVCSATHRVLRDRRWLIISPLQNPSPLENPEAANLLLESEDPGVLFPQGQLQLRRLSLADVPADLSDSHIAWLDAADLKFPLLLRRWRIGDYFYPLGMRKKKKLARFFIDSKLSLADKEKQWVLEMDKKIVWIVGRRIDDRFKITPSTKQVLKIEWLPG